MKFIRVLLVTILVGSTVVDLGVYCHLWFSGKDFDLVLGSFNERGEGRVHQKC